MAFIEAILEIVNFAFLQIIQKEGDVIERQGQKHLVFVITILVGGHLDRQPLFVVGPELIQRIEASAGFFRVKGNRYAVMANDELELAFPFALPVEKANPSCGEFSRQIVFVEDPGEGILLVD